MKRIVPATLFLVTVAACSSVPTATGEGGGHLGLPRADGVPTVPPLVRHSVALPTPKAATALETYSVTVNNVSTQDLLFVLARDARLNIDIHAGINGTVTLNAVDQTLPQLLNRIARQADVRWELDGANLSVMPDTPFLRTYAIDYVNIARDTSGAVAVTTQVATSAPSADGAAMAVAAGSNNSATRIENRARHHFWETLERNLKDLLRETDKILPQGSDETVVEHQDQQTVTALPSARHRAAAPNRRHGPESVVTTPPPANLQQSETTVVRRTSFREAASVIVNPEAGIASVRATSRQHEKVQEFLDHVATSAHRQVLIEATIAEVTLNERHQQGVSWQSLRSLRPGARTAGFSVAENPPGLDAAGSPPNPFVAGANTFLLNYVAPGLGISATLSLLETFGKVRVISSPKLSVINNQTAVLKVVDNLVYFMVKADTVSNQTTTTTAYTTNLFSVPVGLVMNVTPQIGRNDTVLLNLRPSLSRQYATVEDPNPDLQRLSIRNRIPVIRTREMESVIRADSGDIVVMGGLMEDGATQSTDGVPGLSSLPLVGSLFGNREESRTKTELVIFLRPVVIRETGAGTRLAGFRPGATATDDARLQ